MNAESNNSRNPLPDQLVALDARLQAIDDDAAMLIEVRKIVGRLLSSGSCSKAEARRALQQQYVAGKLRQETFQLAMSVVDRHVTERSPVTPTGTVVITSEVDLEAELQPETDEDSFGATTVLPQHFVPLNDAESRVQVGSILRDRYLLREKVSGGSMGVVYKALDRRLAEAGSEESSVAIKVLSPALAENGIALRALQQEAAKTRCLVHPNIVRFIDLDRDDDLYFLILEWLDGRTLSDILDSTDARSIDNEAAFRIIRQIGDALDYAHRCGIVHADVKPGNIMIMPNGDAKLFDFGVARVRQQQSDGDVDLGVLGAVTPAYSSLQVLGGEDPVASDDVFSLACLFYRLLAGYRVFGPRNAAEASAAGMQPQRLQGVTDQQWQALKKALSYPRVTRFGSVREFIDALGEPAPEQKVGDVLDFEAPERFSPSGDSGSPGRWIAIVVVLFGLAGIGANQLGYLDPWLEQFGNSDTMIEMAAPETIVEQLPSDPIVEMQPVTVQQAPNESAATAQEAEPSVLGDQPSAQVSETQPAATTDFVDANNAAAMAETEGFEASGEPERDADPVEVEPVEESEMDVEAQAAASVSRPPLVDFSKLPPADAVVRVSLERDTVARAQLSLREDSAPLVVDFIRDGTPDEPLALRLEEVAFTGNSSPWAGGQYALTNAGLIAFPAGQHRARITLHMASDPRRELDQQVTLRLRPNLSEQELAVINLTLEDDDRRVFESRLPSNTVGFAASQLSVSESGSAVQVDVIRFNPDDTTLVIGFTVEGLTATEGEDYVAPNSGSISFGANERTARIMVPLVQDSLAEGDEAFVIKLDVDRETQPIDVSPNLAVMIRDDER